MISADTETMAEVGAGRGWCTINTVDDLFGKKRKSGSIFPCRQWDCNRDTEQPLQCSVHGQLVILQMDLW